ncbi:putative hydrolase or acyltransferase of alpha/beta superfamily [Paraburkholderia piptadeniae]|uniref:Hydrolase or acyltransferase of alpha/beta superfamily n=1 Tax=Paraburkholderia piptadeniae TaxID=1701573 RepID=A0A1N7SL00_9BURK|nr:alpha/beta hydrolase [Paraburkholderia piptadeniae]SIT48060.1 putative hydrolase or acyltransferase of alpha/beta superfamily [Paraburkholderia piptadeniae]
MKQWTLDQTFTYRDQAVRYRTFGDGPPIVLIHGTPFSSWVWHRIAPHLAHERKVYVYDLPGYGQSEMREGQDVSLGVQNGVLAALLAHWKLDAPDVVAHDFGGATALRAHLIDGCEYRSLTLIDPVAVAPWGSPFVRHVREHAAVFAGLPAYIHAAIVDAYIRGAVARPISADDLAPYVEPWLGDIGQPAFYRQIAQMDQRYTDEVEVRYPQIRCRTQILWGEDDQWIPIERGRHLAGLVPGARFQAVPNAGHLMQEDAPEAIVAAVMRWID